MDTAIRNLAFTACLFFLCCPTPPAQAGEPPARGDRILIQPRSAISANALARFHALQGVEAARSFPRLGNVHIVSVPGGVAASNLIARYRQSGLVEFAEPDYLGHVFTTPNDPRYTDHTLWNLDKISAPAGWDVLTSASNIVVAVVDTGVRYTHEDLAANMWTRSGDGIHGINVVAGNLDPTDDGVHGTAVAGVLGAVGNNAKGICGVAWRTQIMACKCFNGSGVGSVSDVIAGLDFARTNGARLINASWGFPDSAALSNAVYSLRYSNIIVVAACGNSAINIETNPTFPASYSFDHVVTVASTTQSDTLAPTSNFGVTHVHLAAPGENIYAAFPATDSFYFPQSGTSFAAPHVTGALALLLAKFPSETPPQIIARLLNAVDPLPALSGKCITSGRLNLRNALNPPIQLTLLPATNAFPIQLRLASGANRLCVIQVSTNLVSWSPLTTNTTAADGTFLFTDPQATNAPRRFYRATSSL